MSEERDIDVEELRGDIEQIKRAMGLQERYAGAASTWIFFGLAVPVASALSQYVVVERLPQWYITAIWFVVLGGGFVLYAAVSEEDHRPNWGGHGDGPNLFAQFGIVYLAVIPLQEIAFEYAGDLDYVAETGMALAIIVAMLGVAYAVLGTSMRAFRVRRRDRALFYVGTVWMLGLAVAIAHSSTLEYWAFAVFGGLYFLYAASSYAAMRAGGGAG